MTNRIQNLFKIRYPIVQAGMVWCSGWRLASAVSNAGGLGLIGSGSMPPETLPAHTVLAGPRAYHRSSVGNGLAVDKRVSYGSLPIFAHYVMR